MQSEMDGTRQGDLPGDYDKRSDLRRPLKVEGPSNARLTGTTSLRRKSRDELVVDTSAPQRRWEHDERFE